MKFKKVISLLLIILTSFVGLTGCSQKQETSKSLDENQKITIKYWVPFTPNQYIKSLNESEMYKELERRTNVHVEFIHPAEGQEKEQFNLI